MEIPGLAGLSLGSVASEPHDRDLGLQKSLGKQSGLGEVAPLADL